LRQIEETYLKPGTGKVRFIYHHMAFLGPESQYAAEASECANEQGKFWEYADTLFANQRGENQGGFNLSRLKSLAQGIPGLDTGAFNACVDSRRYRQTVEQETQQGEARGVQHTPTIFINNQEVPADFGAINQRINQILAQP